MNMIFTHVYNQETLNKALKLAKGSYQRGILLGNQRLSGADLRGTAKSYIGKYRQSSLNLIKRCKSNGLNVYEVVGRHNRRELVIG